MSRFFLNKFFNKNKAFKFLILTLLILLIPTIIFLFNLYNKPYKQDTIKFRTIADTHVTSEAPTKNFGTNKTFQILNLSILQRKAYIMFDISEYKNNDIKSSKLRLYVKKLGKDSKEGIIRIYSTSTKWNERKITWNSVPQKQEYVADMSIGTIESKWYEVDISEFIINNKNNKLSFLLETEINSDISVTFASKESGDFLPELILSNKENISKKVNQKTEPSKEDEEELSEEELDKLIEEENNSGQITPPLLMHEEGNGLKGEYFEGLDFNNLKNSRIDPIINFNWKRNKPFPSIGRDRFSVRWSGKILAPETSNYTLYVNSDDGARLWINGQVVVDNWVSQSAREVAASIHLVENTKYDILLHYFDNRNDASIYLSWSTQIRPKEIIPTKYLFSE